MRDGERAERRKQLKIFDPNLTTGSPVCLAAFSNTGSSFSSDSSVAVLTIGWWALLRSFVARLATINLVKTPCHYCKFVFHNYPIL